MANIRLEQMTPTQKVAALLITLGPTAASEIMRNIEDDNALEQITLEIAGLSKLPQDVIEAVVDEFHTKDDIQDIVVWIKGTHKYFLQNFVDSGDLIKPDLQPVSADLLKEMQKKAQEFIPSVEIRGI